MKSYLIFVYLMATIAVVSATDYCAMNCHVNEREIKHIACDNEGKFGPDCPQTVEIINMDDYLKQFLLDELNFYRNFIAGGGNYTDTYRYACRMATIQWDNELAEYAALNSKRCKNENDFCHRTTAFPNSAQATLHTYSFVYDSMTSVIARTVRFWFEFIINELHMCDMLADVNIRLGCACSTAPSKYIKKNINLNEYWITCNYATDIQDCASMMYDECNTPGEACNTGKNPAYPNLCSKDEQYEQ